MFGKKTLIVVGLLFVAISAASFADFKVVDGKVDYRGKQYNSIIIQKDAVQRNIKKIESITVEKSDSGNILIIKSSDGFVDIQVRNIRFVDYDDRLLFVHI